MFVLGMSGLSDLMVGLKSLAQGADLYKLPGGETRVAVHVEGKTPDSSVYSFPNTVKVGLSWRDGNNTVWTEHKSFRADFYDPRFCMFFLSAD